MIALLLATLAAFDATAAPKPKCADLSGRYRFETVKGACAYHEEDHTFPDSNSPTPPRDGIFLVPELLVTDGVFIRENSTFDVVQTGCEQLTIRYDESVLNQLTQQFELRSATKTVALTSKEGKVKFRWSDGRAEGSHRETLGRAFNGAGVVHFREKWSLGLDPKTSDLILRGMKRNWGVVIVLPDFYHEKLECRMTRVAGLTAAHE